LFDEYINTVLPLYLLADHQFSLLIDEQRIYSDDITPEVHNSTWKKQASFLLNDHVWEISIVPKDAFLSDAHYRMMAILTMLGALLIIFVGLAAYTALFARNKARSMIDDRNKIDHLLKNLPGIAYQSYNKQDRPMIFVSKVCEELTGWSKAAFESGTVMWGKLIHPDDCQHVNEVVNKAIVQKTFFELEYRIITKNNNIRLVWEKGEAVSSILNNQAILEGFITDITSIKLAEKEIVRSHAFSDAIVNSVVEAVITIDQKGSIKSFNNAAQAMFGYTFDEVKNKNVKALMPRNFADQHDQYLANYLRNQKASIIGVGRELLALRKDGSMFPIHLSVNEIQSNEDTMFVGLIRDITLQRMAADQTRKHIEQMAHAERLNSLGEMAAGIAHEVNQPLTAISLFSQSGKNLCNSGNFERLPEILEKVSQHSRRAGAVLERMQAMTKQGERQKEQVDCNILIDDVVKLAEPDARIRNITIKISGREVNASVFVDTVQIQQVMLNLLRNGMEAMEAMEAMQASNTENQNMIELRMQISPQIAPQIPPQAPPKSVIKISVIDSGCGLSSDMTNKLFTAFSSTKKNGMGIGLSISKSIIEEHGGTIHYASNTPTGSVFYFILPLVE
jgi:two-component system sensor kinase FixL